VAGNSHSTGGVSVYLHIPFCRTRCPYCDFVSNAIPGEVPPDFVQALCTEINHYSGACEVTSVFFGGGTPSLLSPGDLDRIFNALTDRFTFLNPEITLEANPDDVSFALVKQWHQQGINRISLGVQSFDNATLHYLGRRHDAVKGLQAAHQIAEVLDNWNLDLIFGTPGTAAWMTTMQEAVRLNPPHIAAYSLTYEPETPFGKRMDEALDDDTLLRLYKEAESVLVAYDHYEISNFARPGFQCRHNLIYWHNDEYVGFGPGAYSFIEGSRMRNATELKDYLMRPGWKTQVEPLSRREQQVETLIQHFRLRKGISETYYQKRFGESWDDRFGATFERLFKRRLLRRVGRRLAPTRKGFYLNNEIGLALVDTIDSEFSHHL
jgi:oxygen-independent coproporphyrinogen III oxidase